MEGPSNISMVGVCRAPLSVIRADRLGFARKDPFRNQLLPLVFSLTLHALMLIAFSLSVFRAPAVIVSSDPLSIWLIPFVSTGDILSEAEVRRPETPRAPAETDRGEPEQTVAEIPDVPPPAREAIVNETPAEAEATDAEVVVVKRTKKPSVKPKQKKVTVAAAEPAPLQPKADPPVMKSAENEKPVDAEGVHPYTPPAVPVREEKPQPVIHKPVPAMTPVAEPAPAPKEIVPPKEVVTHQPPPVPEMPRKEPVPTPRTAASAPAPQSQRKVDKAVSTPVRAEQRKTPAVTNGGGKPLKKGPSSPAMPAAVPPSAQTAPAPVAQPAVIEKPIAPPVKKQEKPVGIVAPKVTGDIKLIVSGPVVPSLNITFKEFAASRRSKPLTRAEARREPVAVAPLVSSHDGVHHFVVVQAREGIYTIAAQAKDPSASATFQLKLFEGSAREKNRNIGSIKLDNRVVVVRLLMPDGIAWDDDAAFTGDLEDSDSITRFNADTGLVWKEYK